MIPIAHRLQVDTMNAQRYRYSVAAQSAAGCRTPSIYAKTGASALSIERFFCAQRFLVGRSGALRRTPFPLVSGGPTPVRPATHGVGPVGGGGKSTQLAGVPMPKFSRTAIRDRAQRLGAHFESIHTIATDIVMEGGPEDAARAHAIETLCEQGQEQIGQIERACQRTGGNHES